MLFIAIVSLNNAECQNNLKENLADNVIQFFRENKMKYVTFASMDKDKKNIKEELSNLVKKSKLAENLRSRTLEIKHLNLKYRFHQDTLVLVTSSSSRNWNKYLEMIANTKIMSCVVVCIGKLQEQTMKKIETLLESESRNAFFYWIGTEIGETEIIWKQIISVKNNKNIITAPINFDPFGRVIATKNLLGMHINCSTLDWRPWFKLSNCKGPKNTNCGGVGYLPDVINILGSRFNFTWSCDEEPEGNWGNTRPISGPRNASGIWGGVVGNIANGTYPLSISAWRYFYWRKGLLDFVGIGIASKSIVAYIPSGTSYDPGLYLRPFTNESWILILSMSLILILILFCGNRFEQKEGLRRGRNIKLRGIKLALFISSIFSLVTFNGFYKGSLTKFFTKEIIADFESDSDVINSYPDWIYNVRKGMEVNIHNLAETGNKDYQKFASLMEDDPERFVFKNVEEAIKRMKDGRVAVLLRERDLQEYYKLNPLDTRPAFLTTDVFHNSDHLILTDNSPLRPIFNAGALQLMDSGITQILDEIWMGKKLKKERSGSLVKTILNLGQTMLLFVTLFAAIILSIIILGLEILLNWITNVKNIKLFPTNKMALETYSDKEVTVETCEMAPEMLQEAIQIIKKAFVLPSNEEVVKTIKNVFDEKYGGTWMVIAGEGNGFFFSHKAENFIHFYIGKTKTIVIFKVH